MKQWILEHERNIFVGLLLLLVIGAIIGLGRVEFYNEVEQDVKADVFLGYVDETRHYGNVCVKAVQLPSWCQTLKFAENQMIELGEDGGYIGIFADVYYLENRYELRTWFSGRLLKRTSEYYYRLKDEIHLRPVYSHNLLEPEIDLNQLKTGDYDYNFDERK